MTFTERRGGLCGLGRELKSDWEGIGVTGCGGIVDGDCISPIGKRLHIVESIDMKQPALVTPEYKKSLPEPRCQRADPETKKVAA
ncbi:hypothetical protein BLNAU_6395 [Blattamonas nauphoetae]|uniref:Uncharacterized protein n=1 Tax=Blattamonas nauphoetae TaxID=2049346 RepID=A0ABQ9Y4F1_9EUKA|nr:hypothetical protein BLNAU_6395 [Blattamonas nauphoetae]